MPELVYIPDSFQHLDIECIYTFYKLLAYQCLKLITAKNEEIALPLSNWHFPLELHEYFNFKATVRRKKAAHL